MSAWSGLHARFDGLPIAVCLEQSKGALIYALLAYEFLVLYPVNPVTSSGYRNAFKTSCAKTDPSDAEICMELLPHHRDKLKAWLPDDVATRTMRQHIEKRRSTVNLRTDCSNSLRTELKTCFPQALELLEEDLHTALACAFLQRWPSLQSLQRAKMETVRKFYYAHNCRRMDVVEKRLAMIPAMTPLTTDPAILEPALLSIALFVRQLDGLREAIAGFDSHIAKLFGFGSERERYDSAKAIQQYSGIAPVTEASGKSKWIHRRWARDQNSSIKASTNTPTSPHSTAAGPRPFSNIKNQKAKSIPPPSAPSPSSGSGSCTSAGAIVSPTTTISIASPSSNAAPTSRPNSPL